MENSLPHCETLLDGFEEQIALIDASGVILLVNSAWEAFARENGLTDVPVIAENIRKAIAAMAFQATAGMSCLTISAGVACNVPKRGQMQSVLIEQADKALYQAKSSGRNRVVSMPLLPE